MDPELARYLNRNYWQNKAKDDKTSSAQGTAGRTNAQPSAPVAGHEPKVEQNSTQEKLNDVSV